MTYVPHTDKDRQEMLRRLGAGSVEELFEEIPPSLRYPGDLPLPPPLAQQEVEEEFGRLAGENKAHQATASFAGGGVYDHHIPAIVGATVARPEFYSAYTPYQAEVSQGTLQIIFEFQTMIARLTGMDVANASLYDGATALVEGVWMAAAEGKGRTEVVVSRTVHPRYRRVLRSHLIASGLTVREAPSSGDGITSAEETARLLSDRTLVVVVQSPNYFGLLEETAEFARLAHDGGALFLQIFDPISLALLKTPGEAGADIAVGEGQSLGNAMSFGGPLLGLFAASGRFLRKLPGRLSGLTEDADGKRAFTLTLQTREQHIRREKATSNICTNQGLAALAATVYLAAVGGTGLRQAALLCQERALTLREKLLAAGATVPFGGPFFREFAVRFPGGGKVRDAAARLIDQGIIPGIPLEPDYPELEGAYLTAVTEKTSFQAIERFASAVESLAKAGKEVGHE